MRDIGEINKEYWLENNPGKTEADYWRQKGETNERYRKQKRSDAAYDAYVKANAIADWIAFGVYYGFLPAMCALAVRLVAPSVHFWPAFIASAIIIFVLRVMFAR